MIGYKDIGKLMDFNGEEYMVTSYYLNIDGSKVSKKEYEIITKDMIKERSEELGRRKLDRAQLNSVEEDFNKIHKFITYDFDRKGHRGLALYSCTGKKFWQVYSLPRPFKNRLVVDHNPYIHPLSMLLEEYRRYCTIIVDREKARIFEVYLGDIKEQKEVFDEVPAKVRMAGWYGLEEKRVALHIEDHVHRHFRHVTDVLMNFFKKYNFNGLILGGNQTVLPQFEALLPAYLQERIVGSFPVESHVSTEEVLSKSLQVEQEVERKEEEKLVKRLLEEAGAGGLGVVGLEDTLKALQAGSGRMLLVSNGFSAKGSICKGCGHLSTAVEVCSLCGQSMVTVPDIVEEVIELTFQKGCKVEHVFSDSDLKAHGNIGALLRFKG